MALVRLETSFRAPVACTVRVSHGGTDVDWSIAAGDTWDSITDLVADWAAVLLSGFGGSDPTVSVSSISAWGFLHVAATGLWSIDWSHTGDGSALAALLGGTAGGNTATGDAVLLAMDGWWELGGVAGINGAATRLERTHETPRGHLMVLSGANETQGSHAYGDVAPEGLSVAVQAWGTPTLMRHSLFSAMPACIGAWVSTGAGLASLYVQAAGGSVERWTLRLSEDQFEVRPERVTHTSTTAVYRLELPAVSIEVAP